VTHNPTLSLQIAITTDNDWLAEQFTLAYGKHDSETQIRIINRQKELKGLPKVTPRSKIKPRYNTHGWTTW